MRDRFEQWASKFDGTRDEFNLEKNAKGEYKWAVADMVWRAYQAAHADMLPVLERVREVIEESRYHAAGVGIEAYNSDLQRKCNEALTELEAIMKGRLPNEQSLY